MSVEAEVKTFTGAPAERSQAEQKRTEENRTERNGTARHRPRAQSTAHSERDASRDTLFSSSILGVRRGEERRGEVSFVPQSRPLPRPTTAATTPLTPTTTRGHLFCSVWRALIEMQRRVCVCVCVCLCHSHSHSALAFVDAPEGMTHKQEPVQLFLLICGAPKARRTDGSGGPASTPPPTHPHIPTHPHTHIHTHTQTICMKTY